MDIGEESGRSPVLVPQFLHNQFGHVKDYSLLFVSDSKIWNIQRGFNNPLTPNKSPFEAAAIDTSNNSHFARTLTQRRRTSCDFD
jgi:hypothetical protein